MSEELLKAGLPPANDRMLTVLSAEQSAQWKVLLGTPFVGEIHAWRHHG